MAVIKILIANKFFLMNYAIRCILQKIKGFEVYGIKEAEVMPEIKRIKPDILVIEMEILKTDGFLLLKDIKEKYPGLKLLVLLDIVHKDKLLQILEFGLEGYILNNVTRDELIVAAKDIYRGEKYYSKELNDYIIKSLLKKKLNDSPKYNHEQLSDREKEILRHIVKGKNNKEIADNLFISANTVLTHRRNIMRKLNVNNTPQLIYKCFKHNIIPINE